jgi:hypothetical protein
MLILFYQGFLPWQDINHGKSQEELQENIKRIK